MKKIIAAAFLAVIVTLPLGGCGEQWVEEQTEGFSYQVPLDWEKEVYSDYDFIEGIQYSAETQEAFDYLDVSYYSNELDSYESAEQYYKREHGTTLAIAEARHQDFKESKAVIDGRRAYCCSYTSPGWDSSAYVIEYSFDCENGVGIIKAVGLTKDAECLKKISRVAESVHIK